MANFLLNNLRHPGDFYSSVGPTLNELSFGLLGESFVPERDIGDFSGRVVFVTGGNAGLGKETIHQLSKHTPSRIYLGARTESKARDAIADIQSQLTTPVDIRFIPLDLASFSSIRRAAQLFTSDSDRLDTLILNAGTMGNPPVTTEEGYEIQFGTNHIGHFLLTSLLLDTLQKTVARKGGPAKADVRIISVSSVGHNFCPDFDTMIDTQALLDSSTWTRYGASKAANILFTAELARRYPQITSVSIHPGAVASDLYDHAKASNPLMRYGIAASAVFFRKVSSGALNQLWAAGSKREGLVNGGYYTPIGNYSPGNRFAGNVEMGRKLWKWTEDQVAEEKA